MTADSAPKGSREEAFERTYPEVERILGPDVSRTLRGGFKAGWEEAISAVRARMPMKIREDYPSKLRPGAVGYNKVLNEVGTLLDSLAPPEPDRTEEKEL